MKLNFEKKEKTVIIYLYGHVDINVTQSIEKAIHKKISDEEASDFILNLNDVDYVSSAGLGIFISIMGLLKKKRRKLAFCSISDEVRKIFEVVKLTEVFDIFDTEEEALAFLKKV